MAFIREYAAMSGDPFKFRIPKRWFKPPKAIRKLQPGKLLGRVASVAAPFLPGVGGIAAQLASAGSAAPESFAPPAVVMPEESDEEEYTPEPVDPMAQLLQFFSRYYGMEAGDPGTKTKRKQAAAGPRAKAAVKKSKRAQKAMGKGKRAATSARKSGPSVGERVLGGLGGLVSSIPVVGGGLSGAGLFAGGTADQRAAARAMGLIPHRRRRINPANVRALRHALSRVEGFGRLARRTLPHLGYKVVRAHTTKGPHFGRAKKRAA